MSCTNLLIREIGYIQYANVKIINNKNSQHLRIALISFPKNFRFYFSKLYRLPSGKILKVKYKLEQRKRKGKLIFTEATCEILDCFSDTKELKKQIINLDSEQFVIEFVVYDKIITQQETTYLRQIVNEQESIERFSML